MVACDHRHHLLLYLASNPTMHFSQINQLAYWILANMAKQCIENLGNTIISADVQAIVYLGRTTYLEQE